MKAFLICLLVCIFAGVGIAANNPYEAALSALPQPHSHSDPNVRPLTLDEAEQIALKANPEIHVAVRKVAMAEAHIPGAGSLDDPSVMYRGWQVPFAKPWDYNAAMNMFMIGQSFPGPGKRALRSQIATDATSIAKAELEARKQEISAAVRKAFYDLMRAADELRVHDQQVAIARQAFESARIKYSVGKVPQQDVLKAQIGLTKLIEHLIMIEQDADLSRAALNTLLGRSPDTPLEVSGQEAVPAHIPTLAELKQLAVHSRPDLMASAAAIKQAQDADALAHKQYTPDFSANAGYMLMPAGSQFRNNYMIEGSMTLPWLNRRKHDSEINEAQATVEERQAELDAMRLAVFRQIQEALVRANSAKRLVDLYQNSLRPQSEATLQSTVIAYENDRTDILNLLDSQNTTLDVDYAYFRALAEFEQRMAELELAVGAPIPRAGPPAAISAEVTR
ncbi:MAG TPA: TolC family protein [Candidatus Angelobacter sp.]|nr:TolC family protein [Candidatus Angelobacter sp.]